MENKKFQNEQVFKKRKKKKRNNDIILQITAIGSDVSD
jgi:hypothetical protein